jgi:hypothetical protein
MLSSREAYKNASITDPHNIDIHLKKPNNDMVKKICSSFLDKNSINWIITLLNKVNNPIKNNNYTTKTIKYWPSPYYYESISSK